MKTTLGTRTGPDKEVHLHLPSGRRELRTGQERKKKLDLEQFAFLKKRRKQRRNLGILMYFKKAEAELKLLLYFDPIDICL